MRSMMMAGAMPPAAHIVTSPRLRSRRSSSSSIVPIRIKPAGDLDATSSDVSLAEMDVAFERFVIANAGEALAP